MGKYLRTGGFIFLLLISFSFAVPPKNVIILIGDGMGPEQVKAAGMYANGSAGTLSFESLPFQAECTTYSANNPVTDSAAAATAIATGHKVNNDVISIATPGDGSELETLLEYFKAHGKSTGLVTTTYIAHATPAGFGAHESSRSNYSNIVNDYLTQTLPNVMMGGAKYLLSSAATSAGYTVVTSRSAMQSLDTNAVTYVSGQFGSDYMPYEYDGLGTYPHLHEMTETALDILDNDSDGFFLMVEGGRIDHAGHANDIRRNIQETIEFSNTVQVVLDWLAERMDTLVIVTADHETGGLTAPVIQQGIYPSDIGIWSTTNHTATNVPVYAIGVNAEHVSGIMDNTNFFDICISDEMPADLDGDRCVDFVDFSKLAGQWQAPKNMSDLQMIADAWLSGITRFALWFDGVDDYVEITGYKGITGTASRTCSAWIKTNTIGGQIISWGDGATGGKWVIRINAGGQLRAEVEGGNIIGTTPVNDNVWHHIAITIIDDGSPDIMEAQLYVDGQLETISAYVDEPINTNSVEDVMLGAFFATGTPRYFQGLIDEVRIYDRALSEVEISSITNITNGLVAHWKLDEGTGSTAEDSVSGHTGTIHGAAWFPGK